MTRKMWSFNTGDYLIEVIAWAVLTVISKTRPSNGKIVGILSGIQLYCYNHAILIWTFSLSRMWPLNTGLTVQYKHYFFRNFVFTYPAV
jgi:hypothetical protein